MDLGGQHPPEDRGGAPGGGDHGGFEGAVDPAVLRLQPHNFEAEAALLGALLANNSAYDKVSDYLQPEHFADGAHGRIFAAIGRLIGAGQLANPVTLKNYFDKDAALEDIGGADYLAELAGSVVTSSNAGDYGRLIYDLYLRRQLITLGDDILHDARSFDIELQATAQIEQAEQRLFDLATTGEIERGFQDFRVALTKAIDITESAFRREGRISGVPSGFRDLDAKLGGLHASDLIILAARPSMGKTALATNIAFNAATSVTRDTDERGETVELRHPVAFFSLEMSAEQLAMRVIAEKVGVSSEKLRRGELGSAQFESLVRASRELAELPLYIDDTPALSIAQVRTRARRLKRTHGLSLIVVDYLQLLAPSQGRRSENRVQEVSEITRGLKALAKELDVPVIALSQLSRAVEQREDKRPQLADLRESGSIEQDADVVMFIFREQYYLERAEPAQRDDESLEKFNDRHDRWMHRCEEVYNTGEVIIAKQRHGPIGTIRLSFDGQYTKFSDLAQEDRLPEQR
ncbi:MAG: replicative DNA helicase [Alphaproteobacteria bacterium]